MKLFLNKIYKFSKKAKLLFFLAKPHKTYRNL